MVTTLKKYEHDYALVIDQALQDALGITPETPLQITVQGSALVITPADNVELGREKVLETMGELRQHYGRMLKNLAQ